MEKVGGGGYIHINFDALTKFPNLFFFFFVDLIVRYTLKRIILQIIKLYFYSYKSY